jgi:glycosyltransferase involved in cell wall biosynthesis
MESYVGGMRIILWHGYLLAGSGSNLYTANVARIWRAQGHDVLLMCQETNAEEPGFIDAHGDFNEANDAFELAPTGLPAARGRCRLVRPNIARLLPVYVIDDYEGFVVKSFVDLDDAELDRYWRANSRALQTAIERHRPDAIVTGHEVMGPYIALDACRKTSTSYLAKLHGSALEYAVKVQERYRRYAREGLGGAAVVAGGSHYMIAAASAVVPGWEKRAVVVNPGCDVDLFAPFHQRPPGPPRVGYVGKLIAAKGVHHLLCALAVASTPDVSATIVGYGGYESGLRALWGALRRGDLESVREVAQAADDPLPDVVAWLDSGGFDGAVRARAAAREVAFAGRLDHGPLARVLPGFDVLVVPSVVPEAFGMVAAEAAACGVLPIVPAHSGIGEVGAALEAELDRPGFLTYDPRRPIHGIAAALDEVLALPEETRRSLGLRAAALARRRWSWDHVADQLLTHARI